MDVWSVIVTNGLKPKVSIRHGVSVAKKSYLFDKPHILVSGCNSRDGAYIPFLLTNQPEFVDFPGLGKMLFKAGIASRKAKKGNASVLLFTGQNGNEDEDGNILITKLPIGWNIYCGEGVPVQVIFRTPDQSGSVAILGREQELIITSPTKRFRISCCRGKPAIEKLERKSKRVA